jgi:outer membrane protein OmpA-like peptidoglycan-associated protein
LLASTSFLGCHAQGEASTAVRADVHANAEAPSVQAEASVTVGRKALTDKIRLEQDRLEYEGEINFTYNDAALEGEDTFETLGQVRDILREHEDVELHIEGHADSRGSDDYNLRLSQRRAAAVREWLVEQGIEEGRLTSEGYGEDRKDQEPGPCRDRSGPDALFSDEEACLEAWRKNRRTVLRVTRGLSSLQQATEPAPVAPAPARAPAEPRAEKKCRWPVGVHVNLLGPNAYGGLALATEPWCLEWLELSAGVSYGQGDVEAGVDGGVASGTFRAWSVPLRARFWFFPQRHAFLMELGGGGTHYRIEAEARDPAGNTADASGSHIRAWVLGGVGYGYRAEGGARIALLVGGLAHVQHIDPFQELTEPASYAELSLGYLF